MAQALLSVWVSDTTLGGTIMTTSAKKSPMRRKNSKLTPPTYEAISRLAYEKYEARGRLHGFDREDWLSAEAELLGGRSRG
jgi:hypothetical protein